MKWDKIRLHFTRTNHTGENIPTPNGNRILLRIYENYFPCAVARMPTLNIQAQYFRSTSSEKNLWAINLENGFHVAVSIFFFHSTSILFSFKLFLASSYRILNCKQQIVQWPILPKIQRSFLCKLCILYNIFAFQVVNITKQNSYILFPSANTEIHREKKNRI